MIQGPPFRPFEGAVEAPFSASDEEILRDLYAVVEAVNAKPVKLTKSGIPPKPLWSAVNQKLVWRDPTAILYDWEEVDQVRFTYLLAVHLDLIRPDEEMWLHTGPGADQLFLSEPLRRARMVQRAYLQIEDWDERCDARDEAGHRHNFGRAFRRDFVHPVEFLRETAFRQLGRMTDGWVRTSELAAALSGEVPDLLLSEVCEPSEVDADGVDPEQQRFVDYWLTLLGRFGWADLAWAPDGNRSRRLCRLTPLGRALFQGVPNDGPDEPALTWEDGVTLEVRPRTDSIVVRYVAERLGEPLDPPRRGRPTRYRFGPETISRAAAKGADVVAGLGLFERRTEAVSAELRELVAAVVARRRRVRIVQNVVAAEVEPNSRWAGRLEAAGFPLQGGFALAAGQRAVDLFAAIGGEPSEGFNYPPEEALAVLKPGPSVHLFYEELPLLHRQLLVALAPEGDPPHGDLTPGAIAALRADGWTATGLVSALRALTSKAVPTRVVAQIEGLFEEGQG